MHVLEVPARMERREAAFPEKEGNLEKNSLCCNFWFLLLLFFLGVFLFRFFCLCAVSVVVWFCCMEDVTAVISSLCSVQEPSEALMETEQVHVIVIPSTCARRWKSWLLSPVPELLISSKPFLPQGCTRVLQVMLREMRAKVMVDLFVGFQKDDPGKWRCSCESRGPPSLGEMGQTGKLELTIWVEKSTKIPLVVFSIWTDMKPHMSWYGCHGNI